MIFSKLLEKCFVCVERRFTGNMYKILYKAGHTRQIIGANHVGANMRKQSNRAHTLHKQLQKNVSSYFITMDF